MNISHFFIALVEDSFECEIIAWHQSHKQSLKIGEKILILKEWNKKNIDFWNIVNFTNKISIIFRELKKFFIIRTNYGFLKPINSFPQRFEEFIRTKLYKQVVKQEQNLTQVLGKAKSSFHLLLCKILNMFMRKFL
jgi:hypothetical protein